VSPRAQPEQALCSTIPISIPDSLRRHSQAEVLDQVQARVAAICGHETRLLVTAPTAAGLPGRLVPCSAAEATQVPCLLSLKVAQW